MVLFLSIIVNPDKEKIIASARKVERSFGKKLLDSREYRGFPFQS